MELNRQWAYSLLKCMKFVKRKATTAKSKHSTVDFTRLKQQFLTDDVVTTVEIEEIPAELILNRYQTVTKIVPSSTWTMNAQGSRRVEAVGVNDKHLITAVFCGSLAGDFLPVQVIYQKTTIAVIHTFNSRPIGTSLIPGSTGPTSKAWSNMLKTSYHTWKLAMHPLKTIPQHWSSWTISKARSQVQRVSSWRLTTFMLFSFHPTQQTPSSQCTCP